MGASLHCALGISVPSRASSPAGSRIHSSPWTLSLAASCPSLQCPRRLVRDTIPGQIPIRAFRARRTIFRGRSERVVGVAFDLILPRPPEYLATAFVSSLSTLNRRARRIRRFDFETGVRAEAFPYPAARLVRRSPSRNSKKSICRDSESEAADSRLFVDALHIVASSHSSFGADLANRERRRRCGPAPSSPRTSRRSSAGRRVWLRPFTMDETASIHKVRAERFFFFFEHGDALGASGYAGTRQGRRLGPLPLGSERLFQRAASEARFHELTGESRFHDARSRPSPRDGTRCCRARVGRRTRCRRDSLRNIPQDCSDDSDQ